MRPEDIDKLFKERLGNTSPTPSVNLWNRLQDRMESEMPQKAPLQLKEEKRSFMWIYSSVAASVSLVLAVGVVFFNIQNGTPEVNQSIVEKSPVELQEKPIMIPPAPEKIAQAEVSAAQNNQEKNITPQATDANLAPSTKSEEVVKTEAIAKATPKAVQRIPAKATAPQQPQATVQQAVAVHTLTERAPEVSGAATTPAVKPVTPSAIASAKANLNAEPVEIIFKRSLSASSQTVVATAEQPSDGLDRKAKLAKNIFKQVRNLASGEEVELSELGINADKVALNTQIGKQKFSKVINL